MNPIIYIKMLIFKSIIGVCHTKCWRRLSLYSIVPFSLPLRFSFPRSRRSLLKPFFPVVNLRRLLACCNADVIEITARNKALYQQAMVRLGPSSTIRHANDADIVVAIKALCIPLLYKHTFLYVASLRISYR